MVFRSSSGITYLSILHEDHQRRLSFNLGVTQKLLMVWDPVASLCQRKPRTPPSVSLGSKGSPFPLLCIKYRREYGQVIRDPLPIFLSVQNTDHSLTDWLITTTLEGLGSYQRLHRHQQTLNQCMAVLWTEAEDRHFTATECLIELGRMWPMFTLRTALHPI